MSLPHILIGAYTPTLPSSWFYRGIMRGLSSKDAPLILATFNIDVYSHYQWLVDNDIHLLHGAPLLLSKLEKEHDFKLIPYLLANHDFIWYLRPSRVVYDKKLLQSAWWSSEASSLDANTLAQGIKAAIEQAE